MESYQPCPRFMQRSDEGSTVAMTYTNPYAVEAREIFVELLEGLRSPSIIPDLDELYANLGQREMAGIKTFRRGNDHGLRVVSYRYRISYMQSKKKCRYNAQGSPSVSTTRLSGLIAFNAVPFPLDSARSRSCASSICSI